MRLTYLVTSVALFTSIKVAGRAVPKDNGAILAHIEEPTSPVFVEGTSPVFVEQAKPTCTRAVCIPVDKEASPVLVEGTSPVFAAARTVSVRAEGTSPVFVEETSPVFVEETSPVFVEGTAPIFVEATSPVFIASPTVSVRAEGTSPVFTEATFPVFAEETSPVFATQSAVARDLPFILPGFQEWTTSTGFIEKTVHFTEGPTPSIGTFEEPTLYVWAEPVAPPMPFDPPVFDVPLFARTALARGEETSPVFAKETSPVFVEETSPVFAARAGVPRGDEIQPGYEVVTSTSVFWKTIILSNTPYWGTLQQTTTFVTTQPILPSSLGGILVAPTAPAHADATSPVFATQAGVPRDDETSPVFVEGTSPVFAAPTASIVQETSPVFAEVS